MKYLARLVMVLALAAAGGTAAADRAAAAICSAPYNCISTWNACKYVCNHIKH